VGMRILTSDSKQLPSCGHEHENEMRSREKIGGNRFVLRLPFICSAEPCGLCGDPRVFGEAQQKAAGPRKRRVALRYKMKDLAVTDVRYS
jgi:hypothetical protein